MDADNPIIAICQQGIAAAVAKRPDQALALYTQAWDKRSDAYEGAVAAHYVASLQSDPTQALHWHQAAIDQALAADARVRPYLPSLWLNLGKARQDAKQPEIARTCYHHGLIAADALDDQGIAALIRPALQARLDQVGAEAV